MKTTTFVPGKLYKIVTNTRKHIPYYEIYHNALYVGYLENEDFLVHGYKFLVGKQYEYFYEIDIEENYLFYEYA
jgi:hypothetical protein